MVNLMIFLLVALPGLVSSYPQKLERSDEEVADYLEGILGLGGPRDQTKPLDLDWLELQENMEDEVDKTAQVDPAPSLLKTLSLYKDEKGNYVCCNQPQEIPRRPMALTKRGGSRYAPLRRSLGLSQQQEQGYRQALADAGLIPGAVSNNVPASAEASASDSASSRRYPARSAVNQDSLLERLLNAAEARRRSSSSMRGLHQREGGDSSAQNAGQFDYPLKRGGFITEAGNKRHSKRHGGHKKHRGQKKRKN